MCAQIFQKPLNLNIRHPKIIYKRNLHIGWSAGGWERPALLFAEDAMYTGGFDLAFFLSQAAVEPIGSSHTPDWT